MELDEAIKHCEEKAEELREQPFKEKMDIEDVASCEECAEEHEQLAKWLKQLQEVKKIVDEWHTIRNIQDADDSMADHFNQILEVFKE